MAISFVIQSEVKLEAAHSGRKITILRARHLGMCFGVRDAIALAYRQASVEPLTVLGELVHNETVLARLRERGVAVEQDVTAVSTPTAMITAHGASDRAIAEARERGLRVLEATCPLVHYAHQCVRELVAQGFHPVIVGLRGHVEVQGVIEDLREYDVVLTPSDVESLRERPRFGVAAQTTQPIERVQMLVELIRMRFPRSEVVFRDTVCRPTKQRQSAAEELAQLSDLVIVIGGAHSNNTCELVARCRQFCARVHHVQTADDLREEWLHDVHVVGLTAGTSTPDEVIDDVERRLNQLAEGRGR